VARSRQGTPQGAGISPLLANFFLHYVLDLWVHQWRRRHARGRVSIVRYADDFELGFESAGGARRMMADLKDRLAKFGLSIYDPGHYVPVLARKPGAPRNGGPLKNWPLPASLERFRRKLRGSDDGDRQMLRFSIYRNPAGVSSCPYAYKTGTQEGCCGLQPWRATRFSFIRGSVRCNLMISMEPRIGVGTRCSAGAGHPALSARSAAAASPTFSGRPG
jgi:Reverse transcriptase (RNA-dependent DNA polymerase)